MKVSSTSILSLVLALNGAMASALQARGYEVVTVTELATEYVHVTSTAWVEPAQDAPTPIPTTAPDSHEKNKNKNHVTTDTPSTTQQTTLSILSVSESSTTTISTPSTPPAPAPTTKSIPADTKPPTTLQTSTLPPTTPVSTPAPKAEPSTTAPAPVPSAPAVGTPNVGSSGGSGENHVGDATFYAPGLGSCGITSTESQYVAALAAPLMDSQKTANSNNNPFCENI
ncbi:hypothetical protein HOY82DRAFT_74037 [Tuber indicum]|nr:hypothetical protein HOY82DRAFT_74037 [Tuber indicum]